MLRSSSFKIKTLLSAVVMLTTVNALPLSATEDLREKPKGTSSSGLVEITPRIAGIIFKNGQPPMAQLADKNVAIASLSNNFTRLGEVKALQKISNTNAILDLTLPALASLARIAENSSQISISANIKHLSLNVTKDDQATLAKLLDRETLRHINQLFPNITSVSFNLSDQAAQAANSPKSAFGESLKNVVEEIKGLQKLVLSNEGGASSKPSLMSVNLSMALGDILGDVRHPINTVSLFNFAIPRVESNKINLYADKTVTGPSDVERLKHLMNHIGIAMTGGRLPTAVMQPINELPAGVSSASVVMPPKMAGQESDQETIQRIDQKAARAEIEAQSSRWSFLTTLPQKIGGWYSALTEFPKSLVSWALNKVRGTPSSEAQLVSNAPVIPQAAQPVVPPASTPEQPKAQAVVSPAPTPEQPKSQLTKLPLQAAELSNLPTGVATQKDFEVDLRSLPQMEGNGLQIFVTSYENNNLSPQKLVSLVLPNWEADLESGLKLFKNIKNLVVPQNNIEPLSRVQAANLQNLEKLTLEVDSARLPNVTPRQLFSKMPQLKELRLVMKAGAAGNFVPSFIREMITYKSELGEALPKLEKFDIEVDPRAELGLIEDELAVFQGVFNIAPQVKVVGQNSRTTKN